MSRLMNDVNKPDTKKLATLVVGAVATLALVATIILVNNATTSTASATSGNVPEGSELPAGLQDVDYMWVNDKGQIVVDLEAIPANYEDLLDEYEVELDERVFVYEGTTVLPGPERRALDLQRHQEAMDAQGGPFTAPPTLCSEAADVAVGGVAAYVGCDEEVGHQFEAVDGVDVESQLARALSVSLDTFISSFPTDPDSSASELEPTVTLDEAGVATVDFPQIVADYPDLKAEAAGAELWYWLIRTAMTSPEVDGVEFLLEGDCQAFSVATAGDICSGVRTRTNATGDIIK